MSVNTRQPKVFIIVLNWNRKDDTIACVESVLACRYNRQHVVVVDNGSQDGSLQACADRFAGAIHLIGNEKNLGFAQGINVGVRYALEQEADHVLLLNNDTVVDARLIDTLLSVVESDPTLGVLGPAIYYHDEPGRFWRLGAVDKRWVPVPVEIGRDTIDTGQFTVPFDVDYVTGCAMWVRAELFETVGLLDEGYFMYYEDADFCQRAREAGYRIAVVPQARVWHRVSQSANMVSARSAYHRVFNRVVFYNRHKRGLGRVLANLHIGASTLGQIVRARRDRPLVKSLWNGLRDGWGQV